MILPGRLETGDRGQAKGEQPIDKTIMLSPCVQDNKPAIAARSGYVDQYVVAQLRDIDGY